MFRCIIVPNSLLSGVLDTASSPSDESLHTLVLSGFEEVVTITISYIVVLPIRTYISPHILLYCRLSFERNL